MQPVLQNGEDGGLDESDDEQREAGDQHDPAQAGGARDVADAGRDLHEDMVLGRRGPLLPQPHAEQAECRYRERGRVEDRDRPRRRPPQRGRRR